MKKKSPNPDNALHSFSRGLIPQHKDFHWYKIRSDWNWESRGHLPYGAFFVCTNPTLHKFVLWQLEFHWTKKLGSNASWPWTAFLEGMSAELNRCHHLLSEWNFKVLLQRCVGITSQSTDGELDADRAADFPQLQPQRWDGSRLDDFRHGSINTSRCVPSGPCGGTVP